MAQASKKKLVIDPGFLVALNMLVLSQSNVRKTGAEDGIEELADDILANGLLQNLIVRPVLDSNNAETGMYEVTAGGRRLRALQLLVRRKQLAKNSEIRCVLDTLPIAEVASFAENARRKDLPPIDQYRAFQTLRDKGMGEEEIAAIFFVTPLVVKQRLRLAAVSDKLLDAYAADEMTLEQLMAFTVTPDKVRQEQVWKAVKNDWNAEPYQIRRMLTEKTVAASDRRTQFVGLEAYEAADGPFVPDLFAQESGGGWLQNAALLDRMVEEKLKTEADAIAAEGWKWIEAAVTFPFGHTDALRRIRGVPTDLNKREKTKFNALRAEYEKLEAEYADAPEYPDEVDERLGAIEDELEAFEERPAVYAKEDMARAGVFVHIGHDGALVVERGYVRPEDEPGGEHEAADESDAGGEGGAAGAVTRAIITIGGKDADEEEEDGGLKPLSDRLVAELTAHRTLALRDAVAQNPRAAMTLLLFKLCRDAFHHDGQYGCLEATIHRVSLTAQAPDLKESASAIAITERHEAWQGKAPEEDNALWTWLDQLDEEDRAALLAHLVSLGVNALQEKANPYGGPSAHGVSRRIQQADRLARAVKLNMVEAGWKPTIDNYLSRVPKARILEAVREAKGAASTQLIDHLKKGDMAKEAERLLANTGWLPAPLRLGDAEDAALPAFLADESETPSPDSSRAA